MNLLKKKPFGGKNKDQDGNKNERKGKSGEFDVQAIIRQF